MIPFYFNKNNMWEAVLGIAFFLLFRKGYIDNKLKKFRENLKSGDICGIFIEDTLFKAEIEDIQGTTVFYIGYTNTGEVIFNCRAHISQVYPYKNKK